MKKSEAEIAIAELIHRAMIPENGQDTFKVHLKGVTAHLRIGPGFIFLDGVSPTPDDEKIHDEYEAAQPNADSEFFDKVSAAAWKYIK